MSLELYICNQTFFSYKRELPFAAKGMQLKNITPWWLGSSGGKMWNTSRGNWELTQHPSFRLGHTEWVLQQDVFMRKWGEWAAQHMDLAALPAWEEEAVDRLFPGQLPDSAENRHFPAEQHCYIWYLETRCFPGDQLGKAVSIPSLPPGGLC